MTYDPAKVPGGDGARWGADCRTKALAGVADGDWRSTHDWTKSWIGWEAGRGSRHVASVRRFGATRCTDRDVGWERLRSADLISGAGRASRGGVELPSHHFPRRRPSCPTLMPL